MSEPYDNFFFTSGLTSNVCPGFGTFKCTPPNACARDPDTGKEYCCDAGDKAVCWTIPSTCANDGSTINCGGGKTTWCCLDKSEICTQTAGQINICWGSAHDTLRNITKPNLQDTFSSLSSARPSASSWTFDAVSLIKATQTSSAPPSSTSGSLPTTTGTGSSPTTPDNSSSALSGGAIAGIVVGVIGGIALIALAIFFLMRRRKSDAGGGPAVSGTGYQGDAKHATVHGMHEYYGGSAPSELHGNREHGPPAQELPAESPYSPQELSDSGQSPRHLSTSSPHPSQGYVTTTHSPHGNLS